MDLAERAALVRQHRLELKQAHGGRYMRADPVLDNAVRIQRGAQRTFIRVSQQVGTFVDQQIEAQRQRDIVSRRRQNRADMERIRLHGYDISPDFRAHSARIANAARSAELRQQAGHGSNRWRGSVAQIGRDAAARHPTTPPPRERFFTDPWPQRERQPRFTMTTRPYRRTRVAQHTTD